MITKVPRNLDLAFIEHTFANIVPRGFSRIKRYLEAFKVEMIRGKRIFFMHMAEVGRICNYNNKYIVDIDKRSTYWRRSLNSDKEPEMQMINSSSSKLLL